MSKKKISLGFNFKVPNFIARYITKKHGLFEKDQRIKHNDTGEIETIENVILSSKMTNDGSYSGVRYVLSARGEVGHLFVKMNYKTV